MGRIWNLDASHGAVTGKRIVSTRLHGNVTIREENATAALEVMSRFAANPKWLIYLPPTMSPCETSQAPGLLEHPAQAFAYFRHAGAPRVVCGEKHMGSRAVVIVCRDEDASRKNFGVTAEGIGICHTRAGRRFFDNATVEKEFLSHVHAAATAAGLPAILLAREPLRRVHEAVFGVLALESEPVDPRL